MTEWKDISTAPKHCHVLLWYPEHGLRDGVFVVPGNVAIDGSFWLDDWRVKIEATHWQPLPDPPPQA